MRQTITLACAETGERLYLTSKNKRNTPEKLQLKKYSLKKKLLLLKMNLVKQALTTHYFYKPRNELFN